MRFAFASCQAYSHGLYPAYADMARQDLDLVVHLGDYIYEGPGLTGVRRHAPASELFTLTDYRTRHAQYKTRASAVTSTTRTSCSRTAGAAT